MKIFNTLSGQKEEFSPTSRDEVRMYVCGITPYSDSHLGHAMSYILFDAIRRFLQFRGYRVKYVQNVTDIDDKIIDRAARLGISAHELAERYTNAFFEDMKALNILPADVYPRATEEIPKMLEIIQGLVDKGFAYPVESGVYFRVRNVPDYGKLSNRTLDAMEAGIRIEAGEEKEHPMDFVLWKAAKPGEPSWPSPWGPGRPGWHIECSAMSSRYLGETIDIHGGGQDLIFPHHENEIAQSESLTGKKPFARYWMHNGLLQLGEQKMSKSLGNLITIRDALQKYSADAIRVFVLGSYYRSPLTYSEEAMEAAERGVERLRQAVYGEQSRTMQGKAAEAGTGTDDGSTTSTPLGINTLGINSLTTGSSASSPQARSTGDAAQIDVESYRRRFIDAMDDDFGTAQALATLFDLAREINRERDVGHNVVQARVALSELARILGLTLKLPEKPFLGAEPFIELLIATRRELRDAKQWQLADNIRTSLAELGVVLEDTPKGTFWKAKR
ncbi:MAG: cysteine--tRNA ligase [Chloroflexi bacterium]|nr:cysteine--tRNA ligase [Chloroflexota bacterium]